MSCLIPMALIFLPFLSLMVSLFLAPPIWNQILLNEFGRHCGGLVWVMAHGAANHMALQVKMVIQTQFISNFGLLCKVISLITCIFIVYISDQFCTFDR